jgi:hypothetical protein
MQDAGVAEACKLIHRRIVSRASDARQRTGQCSGASGFQKIPTAEHAMNPSIEAPHILS